MRTTLIIPDAVYRKLKRRAAETGKTISGLVTEFVRRGLSEPRDPVELPPLPSFDAGPPLVDVSDRDALYELIDRERYGRVAEDPVGRERPPADRDGPEAHEG